MTAHRDIGALFDQWNAALQTLDPDQVVDLYAEDAILLPTLSNAVRHNHAFAVAELLDKRVEQRVTSSDAAVVARNVRLSIQGAEVRVNLTVSPLTNHPGWRVVTLSEAGHDDAANEEQVGPSLGAPSILAHVQWANPLSAPSH